MISERIGVLNKYENKVGVKEKRAKTKETQILKKADKVISKNKTKKYYVSGKIHLTKTSEKTNKKGETKVYKWKF